MKSSVIPSLSCSQADKSLGIPAWEPSFHRCRRTSGTQTMEVFERETREDEGQGGGGGDEEGQEAA